MPQISAINAARLRHAQALPPEKAYRNLASKFIILIEIYSADGRANLMRIGLHMMEQHKLRLE